RDAKGVERGDRGRQADAGADEGAAILAADGAGILGEAVALRAGGDEAGEEVDELAADEAKAVADGRGEIVEGRDRAPLAATGEAALHAGERDAADPVAAPGGVAGGAADDVAEILLRDPAMAARGAIGADLTGIGPAADGRLAHAEERTG